MTNCKTCGQPVPPIVLDALGKEITVCDTFLWSQPVYRIQLDNGVTIQSTSQLSLCPVIVEPREIVSHGTDYVVYGYNRTLGLLPMGPVEIKGNVGEKNPNIYKLA